MFGTSILFALALGCDGAATLGEIDPPEEELPDDERDVDEDGFTADEDCDDEDPDAFPGGDEGDDADGVDNDCNGTADDRSVCDGDVADYDDLGDAVDDAPDGFTLLVCPGTYEENLVFDRDLTIQSTDGADDTIIDGGGNGVTVAATSDDVGVHGFTITGGVGGGVTCDDADLTMSGNVVEGNTALDGAGFSASNCDIDVTDSEFNGNTAEGLGGGVYLSRTDGIFDGNVIDGNVALEGGGVAISKGDIAVTNSEITGNNATTIDEEYRGAGSGGGGVWMDGDNDLSGNLIAENVSQYNGGGIILFQTTGDIFDNEIRGNISVEDGAGLYANYSRNHVYNNYIVDNEAYDDAGGGRSYVGQMIFEGNTFEGNSAGDDGGGLKMSHSSNTVRDNVFLNNSAGDAGGGLELDNETADVSGCHFEGNTATRGAGLHSWTNEGRLTISDSTFLENVASDCGGGISMDNNPYTVTLEGLHLTDNDANDGAALCIDLVWDYPDEDETWEPYYHHSYALLKNSFISDNDASDDGGIAYVKGGTLTMVNVSTHDNDGPGAGGIAVKEDGVAEFTNVIFSAVDGDMLLTEDDGVAEFFYCSFWDADGFGDQGSPIGSNGNGELDPDYDDPDGLDFHLGSQSECVDAGDPSISDTDGSRSDMGAYGGPDAE